MTTNIDQPYAYRRRELIEPDWTRLPGWRDVTAEQWADAQWQRAHCVKNVAQLRALMGDLLEDRFYADLERDQAERATMSMLVPPQMMNTMVPEHRRRHALGRRRVHRGVLRRPGAQLHAPGLLRPSHRLAEPPVRDARQPARARHVGRRGAHPPLPHQGARRDAADVPAVLRPLHADGPRRQLDAAVHQAQAGRQAGRPLRRDARLPAPLPRGARRRRLRRRRGQHAVEEPRGVPRQAARGRQHPRHPARHQGADGPAPALAAGRRRRGRGPRLRQGPLARCVAGHPHPRQQRPVGHPARREGRPGDARRRRARRAQPGRADARGQRLPQGAARPLLRAPGRGVDHARTTSTCAT